LELHSHRHSLLTPVVRLREVGAEVGAPPAGTAARAARSTPLRTDRTLPPPARPFAAGRANTSAAPSRGPAPTRPPQPDRAPPSLRSCLLLQVQGAARRRL